jgi:hypothetical protein
MMRFGLTKRVSEKLGDDEVGMLDVSANALAVLILATMLVISLMAPPLVRGEIRSKLAPLLHYPSPLDGALAPHSRYIIVLKEGLVEMDLNAFALGLSEQSIRAETPQGTAVLVTDRRLYRDLNDYRLRVKPDWEALAAQVSPLEEAAQEVQRASHLFKQNNIASTYLVSSDAIDTFANLYWKLREAQPPIRWISFQKGQTLILSRRVENFERRMRQWQ